MLRRNILIGDGNSFQILVLIGAATTVDVCISPQHNPLVKTLNRRHCSMYYLLRYLLLWHCKPHKLYRRILPHLHLSR